jgi:hypothetical protein
MQCLYDKQMTAVWSATPCVRAKLLGRSDAGKAIGELEPFLAGVQIR